MVFFSNSLKFYLSFYLSFILVKFTIIYYFQIFEDYLLSQNTYNNIESQAPVHLLKLNRMNPDLKYNKSVKVNKESLFASFFTKNSL